MAKFTWVDTYKEISQWLLTKEKEQPYLIKILKEVGIEVSNDVNEHGERFELNEIDPFTFFAHLNIRRIQNGLKFSKIFIRKLD